MVEAILWLALNIHHEARGEPFHCQVAVGEVVRRRVESSVYPNTYEEVVLEPKQFSWANDKEPDFTVVTLDDLSAAAYAMYNDYTYTTTELHYAATWVDNYWTKKMTKTYECSGHIFYDNGGKR